MTNRPAELDPNPFLLKHLDPDSNTSSQTLIEMSAPAVSTNPDVYNPRKVLGHPKFRILGPDEKPSKDANIAAFYNPQHEIHLVEKPLIKPGPGQVLVHVRATGICG